MDFDRLPLPPPDADFIGGDVERSHRSHHACGFTLEQMKYNCRVTESRRLAAMEAATTTRSAPATGSTPIRDGLAAMLEILQ